MDLHYWNKILKKKLFRFKIAAKTIFDIAQ